MKNKVGDDGPLRPCSKNLDLIAPAVDPPNEEVRRGVHRLNGQTKVLAQAEERAPLLGRPGKPHQADVLGRAVRQKPQPDQRPADEKPFAAHALEERIEHLFQATSVEFERHSR